MRHECTSTKGYEEPKNELFECSCSILSLLLRYSIHLGSEAQTMMNKLFLDLFVVFEFKKKLGVEFLRMINFFVDWAKIKHGPIFNSRIIGANSEVLNIAF